MPSPRPARQCQCRLQCREDAGPGARAKRRSGGVRDTMPLSLQPGLPLLSLSPSVAAVLAMQTLSRSADHRRGDTAAPLMAASRPSSGRIPVGLVCPGPWLKDLQGHGPAQTEGSPGIMSHNGWHRAQAGGAGHCHPGSDTSPPSAGHPLPPPSEGQDTSTRTRAEQQRRTSVTRTRP